MFIRFALLAALVVPSMSIRSPKLDAEKVDALNLMDAEDDFLDKSSSWFFPAAPQPDKADKDKKDDKEEVMNFLTQKVKKTDDDDQPTSTMDVGNAHVEIYDDGDPDDAVIGVTHIEGKATMEEMKAGQPVLDKMIHDSDKDEYNDRDVISVTDLRDAQMADPDVIAEGMKMAGEIPEDKHKNMGKAGLVLPDDFLGNLMGGAAKMLGGVTGTADVEVFHNEEDAMKWAKHERDVEAQEKHQKEQELMKAQEEEKKEQKEKEKAEKAEKADKEEKKEEDDGSWNLFR